MTDPAAGRPEVDGPSVDGPADEPVRPAPPVSRRSLRHTPAPVTTAAAAPGPAPDDAPRRPPRARTVVAAVTSTVLVAAVTLAGVQLHTSRQRAAEAAEVAERVGLAARVAEQDAAFLAAQDRLAVADRAAAARATREAVEAERAAAEAEAARLAQEAADAEAARLAQEAADAQARAAAPATGSTAPSGSGSRIAGWVDGRPVDAAGNVLWVTSVPTADGDGSNGRMPMSSMCLVPWGTDQLGFAQYLRCDAADALTALNQAFTARFGASIDMDLTYRSYADQVAMKAAFGGLAAAPGTSSHGTGTALDVQEWAIYDFGSERYTWLVENGPTYGWYAPARVRQGEPYAEYWHFEYGPGRTS